MRIGVVGLGFMGSTHLAAYQKVSGVQVTAVASSDAKKLAGDLSAIQGNLDRAESQIDFTGMAKHSTPEELFADPNVEAVDLCVPTYLHPPLAEAALAAGKHVLVEKPMALSTAECRSMLAASQEARKVLMVAQVIRFWPDYLAAKQIIDSGGLGAVLCASFRRKCAAPAWGAWLKDKSKSGGGVFDLLIHDVDFCLYMFGRPTAVTAVGVENLDLGVDQIEARFAYGDFPVTVSGGWHHPESYPFSMEFTITCEKATLDFHSGLRRLTLYRKDGACEEAKISGADGFEAELEAFVAGCGRGEAPENCRPQDSALSTEIALKMNQSRELSGEVVEI